MLANLVYLIFFIFNSLQTKKRNLLAIVGAVLFGAALLIALILYIDPLQISNSTFLVLLKRNEIVYFITLAWFLLIINSVFIFAHSFKKNTQIISLSLLLLSILSNFLLINTAHQYSKWSDLNPLSRMGRSLSDAFKPMFFEYRSEDLSTVFANPYFINLTLAIIIFALLTSLFSISSVILIVFSALKNDIKRSLLLKKDLIYIFGYENKYEYLLSDLKKIDKFKKYTIVIVVESGKANVDLLKNHFNNSNLEFKKDLLIEDHHIGNGLIGEVLNRNNIKKKIILSLYNDDKITTKLLISFTKYLKSFPSNEREKPGEEKIKGYFGLNNVKTLRDWDKEIADDKRIIFYSYPELASLLLLENYGYSKLIADYKEKDKETKISSVKYIFVGFGSISQSHLKNLLIVNQSEDLKFSYHVISKESNDVIDFSEKKISVINKLSPLDEFKQQIRILRYSNKVENIENYLPLGISVKKNDDFIDKKVNYYSANVNSIDFLNNLDKIIKDKNKHEIVNIFINTGDDFSNITIASKVEKYITEEIEIKDHTKIIAIVKDVDLINYSKKSSETEILVNFAGSIKDVMKVEKIVNLTSGIASELTRIMRADTNNKDYLDLTPNNANSQNGNNDLLTTYYEAAYDVKDKGKDKKHIDYKDKVLKELKKYTEIKKAEISKDELSSFADEFIKRLGNRTIDWKPNLKIILKTKNKSIEKEYSPVLKVFFVDSQQVYVKVNNSKPVFIKNKIEKTNDLIKSFENDQTFKEDTKELEKIIIDEYKKNKNKKDNTDSIKIERKSFESFKNQLTKFFFIELTKFEITHLSNNKNILTWYHFGKLIKKIELTVI